VIISLVFVFALNNSAKAQLELPKGADDILKEIAELVLDAGILGCELNNNILGLRSSDYLSVKFGVEINEETRGAVIKTITLHSQNILKNNPDYPKIIKRNGN